MNIITSQADISGKTSKSNKWAYREIFPDSSVGIESTCKAGDHSFLPGLERSAGEGIGYPLQCSWASLVAQMVNNLPAMWETCVQSLGLEDPLEKGKATFSSILTRRIPWIVESMGLPELDMTERFSLMKWINSAKVRSKKKQTRKHNENK